ncbi:MAG: hypothetical protein AB1633_02290 [Elusimicrobiota bacterium]
MSVEVFSVKNESDLKSFIKFPWEIYKNDKYWVPPLTSEMYTLLDREKNPFWKHADRELFLARKNGKITGRVAAVIDNNYVSFQEKNTGFFSFFESEDDVETAHSMLNTVSNWLKKNKMAEAIGPTAPSTNDEMGFLLDGYDSSPFLMMPYNPPYYHTLIEKCGFSKAKDLYAYYMSEQDAPRQRLEQICSTVMKKYPSLVVRPVNLNDYLNEIKRIRQVYNNAWIKNWGFVPWTEEEFYAQCERLKQLIVKDLTLMALIDEKPVGILIAVPNYNDVLKHLNGRLGPVGVLKFLWYKSKIKTIRVMIMGVIKEYRNRGIEAVMYKEIIKNGVQLGYPSGEFSWILEDNVLMNRAAEMLGGRVYKKYRVYQKDIG